MSDSKSLEERWFHEKEAREREQARRKREQLAASEQKRRQIAENLGTDDAEIVARIQALGLDGAVAKVLHLLPLVHVAWADDSISVSERRSIMEAVAAHGIAESDPAAVFMASMLEVRPSKTLMSEILSLLKDILVAKGISATSMIEACEKVAEASGGLLGFGDKMDARERDALLKVISILGPAIDIEARSKFS